MRAGIPIVVFLSALLCGLGTGVAQDCDDGDACTDR